MEKKLKIIVTLLIFSFLFFQVNLVQAAPAPWGVALNHGTKECAGFWAGDEFRYYDLPSGWGIFYPDWDSYNETTGLMTIETDIGTFNITSISHGNWHDKFCNETDYTYVSKNIGIGPYLTDLGKQEYLINNIWIFVGIIALIIFVSIFILLRIKKRKK